MCVIYWYYVVTRVIVIIVIMYNVVHRVHGLLMFWTLYIYILNTLKIILYRVHNITFLNIQLDVIIIILEKKNTIIYTRLLLLIYYNKIYEDYNFIYCFPLDGTS